MINIMIVRNYLGLFHFFQGTVLALFADDVGDANEPEGARPRHVAQEFEQEKVVQHL